MALWAWAVHAYTASGLLLAAGMAVLIVRGRPEDLRWAFALMVLACVVDATDGRLARKADVKRRTPSFDGRRLDDIIDFQTYTSLPLLLLWRAKVLPEEWSWVLLLPLVASAYGFCQEQAKTDDGYFLGFPSYWNIIAFYLYAWPMPAAIAGTILVTFAFLTFVPTRYLYPSHTGGALNRWACALGGAWAIVILWLVLAPPGGDLFGIRARVVTGLSLGYPIFYLAASWWVEARIRLQGLKSAA